MPGPVGPIAAYSANAGTADREVPLERTSQDAPPGPMDTPSVLSDYLQGLNLYALTKVRRIRHSANHAQVALTRTLLPLIECLSSDRSRGVRLLKRRTRLP
jgi:hypothetical protein